MVDVFFATNRRPNDRDVPTDFGADFSEDGLANLRFGFAKVTGPNLDRYSLTVAPEEIVHQYPGRPPRVFDQVFLMAPDEDDDAFEHEHKLLPLPRLAKRVNAYFNNEDVAMTVSDKTKGNPDRLGAAAQMAEEPRALARPGSTRPW